MHTLVDTVRSYQGRDIPVAGVYAIDPAHTSVEFVARHPMITSILGRFTGISGTIAIDADPEPSYVEVAIDVASVGAGNGDRDRHLRSADFCHAGAFPTMCFTSTCMDATPSGTWLVTGPLTLLGLTRLVTLEVEFDATSPTGKPCISFSASTETDREDWGLERNLPLEGGGVAIGKKVRIELDVQAVAAH